MSTSRAESQYGRRRSNTAQSLFRNPPQPLIFGDSKVLSTWVHDLSVSPNVLLNQAYWPGITEGDLVKITPVNAEEDDGFLFVVPSEYDHSTKPQLQISVPKPVAERFSIRNNGEVTVTKVERSKCQADYVEFTFQDQYLGRNDMWRLGEQLVGQCVHADQEISFIGSTSAKVDSIHIDGQKVSSGYMSGTTKAIYRSLSAKVTIFIQVCRELWEFAGDGERFNEKIVHSFLPELFARWREAGTNHTVTIVLISRVYYDSSEVDYAEGPLREDEDRRYYKDFFKVITDLEVIHEWQSTLVSLKDSFWAFQRDILLTHHFHRASQNPSSMYGYGFNQEEVRLVGQLSFAHDGPLLEALNMSLNPSETHYIDRSLSHTGSSTIVITPGTGYYRVDKQLLRLTTTRMLDQGFGLDLVSLAKPPLHRSPIFSFRGVDPEAFKTEKVHRYGSRALDPLWGGDDIPNDCIGREKKTFYWEPFWIEVSFWDKQMDLPLRQDRFVARAKMHEIQMLGLLDHDVLSSIEVPLLPEQYDSLLTPVQENEGEAYAAAKREADDFDMDVFAFRKDNREFRLSNVSRLSGTSSSASTIIAPSLRSSEKRPAAAHRSANNPMIAPIEESPQFSEKELPPEETLPVDINKRSVASASAVTTSPQLSIRSLRSEASGSASSTLVASTTSERRSRNSSASRTTSLTSKLTSSWLFSPFRSGPSPAETSPVSASGESTPAKPARHMRLPPTSSPLAAPATMPDSPVSVSPQPVPIRSRASRQKVFEETIAHRGSPHRGSFAQVLSGQHPAPRRAAVRQAPEQHIRLYVRVQLLVVTGHAVQPVDAAGLALVQPGVPRAALAAHVSAPAVQARGQMEVDGDARLPVADDRAVPDVCGARHVLRRVLVRLRRRPARDEVLPREAAEHGHEGPG
ncbi:hypothetical protein EWM64_g7082 [Hericium alpestre]|uniref:Vacuolar membrane-associated protein Iml1 N-terminal domain-containing protein n=1 Tax=Hericium alpestre TaxID=135208 RepID=A0A4Y9ZRS7_9AGAM|nr:hypothetical protein EWM64_g7082 [Hericium alpestre]